MLLDAFSGNHRIAATSQELAVVVLLNLLVFLDMSFEKKAVAVCISDEAVYRIQRFRLGHELERIDFWILALTQKFEEVFLRLRLVLELEFLNIDERQCFRHRPSPLPHPRSAPPHCVCAHPAPQHQKLFERLDRDVSSHSYSAMNTEPVS